MMHEVLDVKLEVEQKRRKAASNRIYRMQHAEELKAYRRLPAVKERKRLACRKYYRSHAEAVIRSNREWAKKNPARVAIYKARSLAKPGVKERMRKYTAVWAKTHVVERRASVRAWQKRNPERVREMMRAGENRRRAREVAAEGQFSTQDWRDIKSLFGYRCVGCGAQEPDIMLTVDHVVPLSRGGRNDRENIQPLCFSCNRKKWTQTIDYRVVAA